MSSKSLGLSGGIRDREQQSIASIAPDTFFVSEVVDVTAHTGAMKVSGPASGVVDAFGIGDVGSSAYGIRKIGSVYPPHTQVICYRPHRLPYVFVLGALPQWVTSGKWNGVPDWIVPACRSGVGFDRVHWETSMRDNGFSGEVNFSGGRPCDSLPGDNGYINELGVSYGIGRLMAWLRASHFCGIEAHWVDNLLRLVGYNLEEMTSGSERRAFNDEGEFTQLDRWGPYPWETTGLIDKDTDFTAKGDNQWSSGKAGREPIADDQAGIWRVQDFKGYLGDIRRTILALPLKDALPDNGVETMSANTVLPGLLDVGYAIDGRYHVRSAKGIVLEKTVVIPVPKEKIVPDDPTGDNPDNYKAAGAFGEGAEHKREEPTLKDDQAGLRSMMLLERHALIYSHFANLPFIRHEKDWLLPTEAQALESLGLDKAIYDSETTIENMKFWMPLPKAVEVDVDHRGKSKYYSGRSFIQIDDDGSIVLEDAYGSQIRMEGGNIFLSARNDVILQPGRSVQAWAPRDMILKAGNSVDMTASLGDVRIKAQGNLMAVAVDKGVLIESKDKGSTPDWQQVGEDVESRGVVLRAMDSKVSTLSKDAYFRAGAREGTTGELHIDSAEGKGDVFVHGGTITNRALSKTQIIVGSTGESDHTVSMDLTVSDFLLGGKNLNNMTFGAANVTFGHEEFPNTSFTALGDVFFKRNVWAEGLAAIRGNLLVGAGIIAQSNMHVKGNAIFTGSVVGHTLASDTSNGFLPSTGDGFQASESLPIEHPEGAKEKLDTEDERIQTALLEARTEDNDQVTALQDSLYDDGSLFAGSDIIEKASFSYRTPKQYGTDKDFKWFEARWQQMNRTLFGSHKVWKENFIKSPHTNEDGMPYPGVNAWNSAGSFIALDHKLFNISTGTSQRLGNDASASDAMAEPKPRSFVSNYIVTVQSIEENE